MTERRGHYIPSNAAQFKAFTLNLLRYVEKKLAASSAPWTAFIPVARFDEVMSSYDAFTTAFQVAEQTPTHANILRRQEAQAAAAAVLRAFVNQFLRFPPVTNGDRAEMGVPNHDTIRTDHKVVAELVDFVIHVSAVRELRVEFWIQGAAHKAKPEGYDGAVLIWGIRDTPPEKPEDLEHHTMASRTPYTLYFEETERGKTVYIALCWQNERGITGAWSEYKSAIIP
jgi:hypothetical protein